MQFTLDKNIQVLSWAFNRTVTKAIDGILIAELPFLATPVVRQIMDQLIGYIVGKLSHAAELQIFFMYTDLRVSAEGRDFIAQASKHQEILKSGTPAEKQASEDELFSSFKKLAMIKA